MSHGALCLHDCENDWRPNTEGVKKVSMSPAQRQHGGDTFVPENGPLPHVFCSLLLYLPINPSSGSSPSNLPGHPVCAVQPCTRAS